MTSPLIVRPEAETDLAEGRDWYEGRQAGLGAEFLAAVDVVFDHIREFPKLYAAGYKDVRRVRMKRFPYVVYFRTTSRSVEIVAVLHGSRGPLHWQSRV